MERFNLDNFEILQKLKEENARLEAEIKAIKNGDTLDNIEIIHPEYDEEIVLVSTARINGRGGASVRFRTCIAIVVSICIIFVMLVHFE